jgi:hypothetical protein
MAQRKRTIRLYRIADDGRRLLAGTSIAGRIVGTEADASLSDRLSDRMQDSPRDIYSNG